MSSPEELAREKIDKLLTECGWIIQNRSAINLSAGRGIAIREALLKGRDEVDYLLFVDGKAIGTVEAKPEGYTLTGVEEQSGKYGKGLLDIYPKWREPLPFAYESTGVETQFTNQLDPSPKSRNVFAFHRPETLLEYLEPDHQLNARLTYLLTSDQMPKSNLWSAQIEAIRNLEKSLAANKRRALIQMATGSGKTYTAVNFVYRLIKLAGARRVLFLVDRGNLGDQTLKEFQQFVTPDDGRKFTELYNVQHLQSAQLDRVSRVCISTIQRLYSMLRGEEIDPEIDERSGYELRESLWKQPPPVVYNPNVPIETFDFIITDECHRSIYNLWRQVLEYFDAYLIGLTATPSKQTIGFFNKNLVMEYGHEHAVTDNVNVPYDVYKIDTEITAAGSRVDRGFYVDKRDRLTRKVRWEQLDVDLAYQPNELDRAVVAPDQIRTVIRAFRDRLFTEIFPGRTTVPKTLIFAKDDSHADDIVKIAREEFDKGNDFCQKITYRTTGASPKELIQRFRNSPNPRIAVTVDMIATGTDIKPLEIVMFMRSVKSRSFFEQMKGRGVRVISDTDFQSVTPDAKTKTHFVIVDAVGVCERDKTDSRPLEQKPSVPLEKLMEHIAIGAREPELLSSLAGRLIRLDKRIEPDVRAEVEKLSGGKTLSNIARDLLDAIDPDKIEKNGGSNSRETADFIQKSVAPIATNPDLRNKILAIQGAADQTIDTVSQDKLLFAGADAKTSEAARDTIKSFRDYIEQHKAEIEALQILYSRPFRKRLTEESLRELEAKLKPEFGPQPVPRIWNAFSCSRGSVSRASQTRRFTDLVSLVRTAIEPTTPLEPFEEHVKQRFDEWLREKDASVSQQSTLNSQPAARPGALAFTPDQLAWLEKMRDYISASGSVDREHLEADNVLGPIYKAFGEKLWPLMDELNLTLAA
jgi:type I restriction enzyme R subunit